LGDPLIRQNLQIAFFKILICKISKYGTFKFKDFSRIFKDFQGPGIFFPKFKDFQGLLNDTMNPDAHHYLPGVVRCSHGSALHVTDAAAALLPLITGSSAAIKQFTD